MSVMFMILVSNFCNQNWNEFKTSVEEPAIATEVRCIYSQIKCWESRGEKFCKELMQ